MKEARAIGNYIRIAPRKARLVVDLIRGRKAGDALASLALCRKGAAREVRKILVSAMANAGPQAKAEAMVVSGAYVDEGPTLKRYMPRAMGRATMIRKRTSRITIKVAERDEAREAEVAPRKKKIGRGSGKEQAAK